MDALAGFLVLPATARAAGGLFGNFASGPPPTSDDLAVFIYNVKNIAVGAAGAVVLAMFLWGAFQFFIAGGSEERAKKGKSIMFAALFGAIIIIMAQVLVEFYITALGGTL